MESQGSSRLIWTPCMLEVLVEGLVEQVRLRKRPDTGFKSEAYNAVLTQVQGACSQSIKINKGQLRTKVDWLKKLYAACKPLLEVSGIGVDPETGRIDADSAFWDGYIKSHVKLLAAIQI